MSYKGESPTPFFKITASHPRWIPPLRRVLENGHFSVPRMDRFPEHDTFESNIAFTLRFMIDNKLRSMSRVQMRADKYMPGGGSQTTSSCQISVDVMKSDLITHEPEGEWSVMAPLGILSFDIEC